VPSTISRKTCTNMAMNQFNAALHQNLEAQARMEYNVARHKNKNLAKKRPALNVDSLRGIVAQRQEKLREAIRENSKYFLPELPRSPTEMG
jgi:porphobilinogen deaminase